MKNKKLLLIVLVILLVAGGIGVYLYLNKEDDDSSDKEDKAYRNVEKTIEKVAKEYAEENRYSLDKYVLVSKLIKEGYLEEEDLEVKKEKDSCTGYVEITKDSKKDKYSANAYIKCENYTTKNFDEDVIKKTETKTLNYEILNEDELDDALYVKNVSLDRGTVEVKGYEEDLDKIEEIKAIIDIKKLDIEEPGEYTAKKLKLVAYDEDEKEIKDIEITTNEVNAKVEVQTYSATVSLKVITKGDLAKGRAIERITITDNHKVTVYGTKEATESLTYLPVEIDVSGLGNEDSKEFKVALVKPEGISKISETHANVKITFGDEITKDLVVDNISIKNLNPELSASLKNEKDSKVTVSVTGAKGTVNSLSKYQIKPYVDLEGLEKGEHEVEIKIETEKTELTYKIKNPKVKIVIS